jgi:PKHD-type hydroxylase
MVRDEGERTILFQLDTNIQRLVADKVNADATVIQLTAIYHNLIRRWADA